MVKDKKENDNGRKQKEWKEDKWKKFMLSNYKKTKDIVEQYTFKQTTILLTIDFTHEELNRNNFMDIHNRIHTANMDIMYDPLLLLKCGIKNDIHFHTSSTCLIGINNNTNMFVLFDLIQVHSHYNNNIQKKKTERIEFIFKTRTKMDITIEYKQLQSGVNGIIHSKDEFSEHPKSKPHQYEIQQIHQIIFDCDFNIPYNLDLEKYYNSLPQIE